MALAGGVHEGTAVTKNILTTMMLTSDENFPALFINKLVTIMENSYDEVTEVLKSKSAQVLKKLRDLAFTGFHIGNKGNNVHVESRISSCRRAFYTLQCAGLCKKGLDVESAIYVFKSACRSILRGRPFDSWGGLWFYCEKKDCSANFRK